MDFFELRTPAKRFRFVAVLEAVSWLGLLIGMAFKWLPENGNEIGVKIFGPIHGGIFIVFVLVSLITARVLSWDLKTTLWALVSSVPPFGTLVFEVWAVRNGRLAELSAESAEPVLVKS